MFQEAENVQIIGLLQFMCALSRVDQTISSPFVYLNGISNWKYIVLRKQPEIVIIVCIYQLQCTIWNRWIETGSNLIFNTHILEPKVFTYNPILVSSWTSPQPNSTQFKHKMYEMNMPVFFVNLGCVFHNKYVNAFLFKLATYCCLYVLQGKGEMVTHWLNGYIKTDNINTHHTEPP